MHEKQLENSSLFHVPCTSFLAEWTFATFNRSIVLYKKIMRNILYFQIFSFFFPSVLLVFFKLVVTVFLKNGDVPLSWLLLQGIYCQSFLNQPTALALKLVLTFLLLLTVKRYYTLSLRKHFNSLAPFISFSGVVALKFQVGPVGQCWYWRPSPTPNLPMP